LRATQLSLLVAIRQDEGTTIQVLAQSMAMDRTTLSRNLRPLERDGLIEIRQGSDLRQRRLHITEQGVARVQAAHGLWREAQRTVERELGGLVVVKLRGDLGRLSRQL
jgi:DNA-binding MarR family transcriptional regulator